MLGSPGFGGPDGATPEPPMDMPSAASSGEAESQAKEAAELTSLFSRVLDLKGVARPPNFSGKESDFADWHFRFMSSMELFGCADYLRGMEQFAVPLDSDQEGRLNPRARVAKDDL